MTRRRAIALVFGLLTAVFVVSSVITIVVIRGQLLDAVDADLRTSLDAASSIANRFDLDDALGLDVQTTERALLLFDGRTEVVYVPAGSNEAPLARPHLTASTVVARVGEPFTVDSAERELDFRVLTTQLDDGRYLALAAPLDDLRTVLVSLSRYLLVTLFALLAVLGLFFWWILRASLRPYDDMIDTAQAIAEGDLSRRAAATAHTPEIEQLTDSLNTMLDQIEGSFLAKESAEERLQQFVADASHELRTPLTTIRGYSEVYLSGAATHPDAVQQQMTRINSEAARMGRLVDELLTLARLDQSDGRPHVPVDLVPIVDDIVADTRVAATDHTITADLEADSAVVQGDADYLRQVVANLLTNARVHTPPGTIVTVGLTVDDARVRLTVTDDGAGMDPEIAAHVFDRFYRADKARTRSLGGSGLGLAIAAAVVEAHHGTIEVDSVPGTGTTFTLELPLADLAAEHPSPGHL